MKVIFFFASSCLFFLNAFAHSHLEKTEPSKASVVLTAPDRVTLFFSEGLETAMCKVEVKNIKTGEIVSVGSPVSETKGILRVGLKPNAPNGTYQVTWKVVSKDTHKMQGAYEFSIDSGKK